MLEARGKTHQLEKVRNTNNLPTPIAVEQAEPLGLGHAVGLAEQVLDDDEKRRSSHAPPTTWCCPWVLSSK